MTILLTNDDGYQSDGLAAARDAMLKAGLHVITLAPDGPRSGNSRAATFRKPVRVDRVGGDDTNPIYACDGTPVDCVRVGLMSDLAHEAAVVVSGINEGANLGDDTTYSSTFGAAVEGALLGIAGIAISQQSRDRRFRLVDRTGYDWETSGTVVAELARLALDTPLPARTVVNANAPGTAPTDGTAVTRLGRRAYRRGGLETATTEHGHGYYTFHVNLDTDPPVHDEDGTDFAALSEGRVALTPVSYAWGRPEVFEQVERWTQEAAARIDTALRITHA
ncbi:5'/3'-nucleotidase SurE [Streptomyces sp. NPDC002491]